MVNNKHQNPFAEYAPQYLAKNYCPIPIVYGDKRPAQAGWTYYFDHRPTQEQIAEWSKIPRNIGICMGRLANVIALDLDADYQDLHAQILKIVPDSPVKKRGAKGFTAFYRYGVEHNIALQKDGHHIGDVLSDGRQTIIPPSIHPTGVSYEWIGGVSLLDVPQSDLPTITSDMWQKINDLLHPKTTLTRYTPDPWVRKCDVIQNIRNALDCIPPDCEYMDWVGVGMALHNYFSGSDWAFNLFDSWSSGGAKYKMGEPAQKWQSFQREKGITIGTLFHIAKTFGYVAPDPMEYERLLSREDEQAIHNFLYGK
ncbi:hypothetical protein AGMMS50222_03940 [Endomicrobiia bacterium]|nr:hypothetical protein AGMMS50222_03940 [Endomicrobiia bacterium]